MQYSHRSIDVVIPTNRNLNNLSNLISQILSQKGSFKISIFIIDQFKKNNHLNVKLLNSNIKCIKLIKSNLSQAKNLGINSSKSKYLTFLDDDVLIPNDYFLKSFNFINQNNVDILFNKILNNQKKPLVLSMSNKIIRINKRNWNCCLASSMWLKNTIRQKTIFDEKFGIGSAFGSGEETDFILKSLIKRKRIYYNGRIYLNHPNDDIHLKLKFIFKKFSSYGNGQGALLKKFNNKLGKYIIFFSVSKSFFAILYYLIFFNFSQSTKHLGLMLGKINGYLKFT